MADSYPYHHHREKKLYLARVPDTYGCIEKRSEKIVVLP